MQPTKATDGSSEKGDTHTQAKPTQSPRKPQCSQRRRPSVSKEWEHTHSSKKLSAKKTTYSTANKGDRRRHTRTTLRKTEMKRVTNDLTHTAIGFPLALEKKAPAARPKTFKKQTRSIEGQATLDTSDKTLSTLRFGPKTTVIPLTPDKKP